MNCRFLVCLDDVAAHRGAGQCVCLQCYGAWTGTYRRMEKRLRLELIAFVEGMDASIWGPV